MKSYVILPLLQLSDYSYKGAVFRRVLPSLATSLWWQVVVVEATAQEILDQVLLARNVMSYYFMCIFPALPLVFRYSGENSYHRPPGPWW